jgi:hypothetical protein
MYFEIWDAGSRNLLYEFDTLEEALDAVQELLDANPEPGRVDLVLGELNEDHRSVWQARGDELLALPKQRPTTGRKAG